jgi:hypothetical protein
MRLQRALDQTAKAVDLALAGVVDQFNRALLAGLEAHRHARCNVQPHAARSVTHSQ